MSRLQPRLKTSATTSTSTQSASTSDPQLRSSTPTSRQNKHSSSIDILSDAATLSLIRRVLCSQLGEKGRSTPAPIDEILPPLTSSNEVDLQLYAFIAIIIREFVHTWYAKITPDHVFVQEVVQVIAHCTRALEQRLRKVELESLLFDELPELFGAHIQAYRAAHFPLTLPPLKPAPRQIYHSLWNSPALSPVPDEEDPSTLKEQMQNEAAYRQLLVQGALAVLLPTEDLENECLTALVGQIFSEMILGGGIGGKASASWLLWEGITKAAEFVQKQLPNSKAKVRIDKSDIKDVNALNIPGNRVSKGTRAIGRSIQKTFWLVLQYLFLAFSMIRFLIITISTSSSLPSRLTQTSRVAASPSVKQHFESPISISTTSSKTRTSPTKVPILSMKAWTCVSNLLDVDARMPWLSATISMLQWLALTGPGQLGNSDGMIDKFLFNAIHTHVLDAALLPSMLRAARSALFPNNTLSAPRIIPSLSEQLLIRRRCAESLLILVPGKVQEVYFGGEKEERIRQVEEMLNVFDDVYCNKHLLYGVVELVIVRLIPELGEKGVEELLEERLSL